MEKTTPESRTIVALLKRLRSVPYDHVAWQEFAERYGKSIRTWCRHWGLQDADVADVAQSVFIRLLQALPSFQYDPRRNFRSWLRTVTHNVWQDLVTNRQRLLLKEAQREGLDLIEGRDDLTARAQAALDQELFLIASFRVRLRVRPSTWEAFHLTAVEGLSGEQVAERLRMKVATVYKAKSNLLKLLQDEVRSLEGEPVV